MPKKRRGKSSYCHKSVNQSVCDFSDEASTTIIRTNSKGKNSTSGNIPKVVPNLINTVIKVYIKK